MRVTLPESKVNVSTIYYPTFGKSDNVTVVLRCYKFLKLRGPKATLGSAAGFCPHRPGSGSARVGAWIFDTFKHELKGTDLLTEIRKRPPAVHLSMGPTRRPSVSTWNKIGKLLDRHSVDPEACWSGWRPCSGRIFTRIGDQYDAHRLKCPGYRQILGSHCSPGLFCCILQIGSPIYARREATLGSVANWEWLWIRENPCILVRARPSIPRPLTAQLPNITCRG